MSDAKPARSRHRSVQLFGQPHRRAAARVGTAACRTLTFHPDRPHPLRASVEALRYRFETRRRSTRSLEGVTHALQHLLGPLRPRPGELRERDRELAHAVLRRETGRRRAHRAPQHHQPLDRVAAAVLQRQGARRVRPGPIRRALLDRQANLDLRRRARHPRQQHRLDPAPHAGVRAARRRRLPRAAGARRRPRANLRRGRRFERRRGHRCGRTRDDAVRRSRRARARAPSTPARRSFTFLRRDGRRGARARPDRARRRAHARRDQRPDGGAARLARRRRSDRSPSANGSTSTGRRSGAPTPTSCDRHFAAAAAAG